MQCSRIAWQLEKALRESLAAPALRLIDLAGERPAIDEQREPWIPVKYGPAGSEDWFGVVPATARFERVPGAATERLCLVVKVNPREGVARTLIPWVAEHKGISLDRPYWAYRSASESDRTAAKERIIYELANRTPALRAVLPRCYGGVNDPETGEHALFLEFIADIAGSTPRERKRTGRPRRSIRRCAQPRDGMPHSGTRTRGTSHGPDHASPQPI